MQNSPADIGAEETKMRESIMIVSRRCVHVTINVVNVVTVTGQENEIVRETHSDVSSKSVLCYNVVYSTPCLTLRVTLSNW